MAFPEYRLHRYLDLGWIREDSNTSKSYSDKRNHALPAMSLEDEIYQLRCVMERLVREGHRMTSPVVVEISTMLDQKINEYMNIKQRGRL